MQLLTQKQESNVLTGIALICVSIPNSKLCVVYVKTWYNKEKKRENQNT